MIFYFLQVQILYVIERIRYLLERCFCSISYAAIYLKLLLHDLQLKGARDKFCYKRLLREIQESLHGKFLTL